MTTTLQTRQSEVVKMLNRQQANALVAYLNYKKYHWFTFGPLFRDLHLLFEEHGNEIFAMIDELAERSMMLDGKPVANPEDYLSVATVTPSTGDLSVREMVEEAIATHDLIINEMQRKAILVPMTYSLA
jgi:starvation-inducible DNA-binding protein